MAEEITLEGLAGQLQELKAANQTLSEQNQKLSDHNEKLVGMFGKTTDITTKEAVKLMIPEGTVTVDKKKYKFTVPHFVLGQEKFIAEQLVADAKSPTAKDVLQKLVDIESGYLVEVK